MIESGLWEEGGVVIEEEACWASPQLVRYGEEDGEVVEERTDWASPQLVK